jgi:hypothetical protein
MIDSSSAATTNLNVIVTQGHAQKVEQSVKHSYDVPTEQTLRKEAGRLVI